MTSGEDWLFAPVVEGLCQYESLKNGTLDLLDIAKLNEAMAVRNENTFRLTEEDQPLAR